MTPPPRTASAPALSYSPGDLAACPVRAGMRVLGGRWAMLLVHTLSSVPARMRFGELRRATVGISEKMLTQELRKLVAAGLVERHDYREVPPRVDYALTDLGRSSLPVVRAVATFGAEVLTADAAPVDSARPKTP